MNLPEEQREKFCERVRSPRLALHLERRVAWRMTFLQKSDKYALIFPIICANVGLLSGTQRNGYRVFIQE